jgi:hypothetical protein
LLLSRAGGIGSDSEERAVNDLLSLELDDRVAVFGDIERWLKETIRRWGCRPRIVVADSTIFFRLSCWFRG